MKIINIIQDNKYLPDPLYPDPEILTKGAEILMKNFAGCKMQGAWYGCRDSIPPLKGVRGMFIMMQVADNMVVVSYKL